MRRIGRGTSRLFTETLIATHEKAGMQTGKSKLKNTFSGDVDAVRDNREQPGQYEITENQLVVEYRKELAILRKSIREERRRGLAHHWNYDLARHMNLITTYKCKCEKLNKIQTQLLAKTSPSPINSQITKK